VYILTLWKSPCVTHKLDSTVDQYVLKVKLPDSFYWNCAILNFNTNCEIIYGIQGNVLLQSFIMNQYGWKLEFHSNFIFFVQFLHPYKCSSETTVSADHNTT